MDQKVVNTVSGVTTLVVLLIICFVLYFGSHRPHIDGERNDQLFSNKLVSSRANRVTSNSVEKKKTLDKNDKVIVETFSGALEGKKSLIFGTTINQFLGIPYAKPPINDLRFSKPEPVNKWSGIRPALNFTSKCPQFTFSRDLVPMNFINESISEDCLTLNIWTPNIKPKKLKTVMVWIHGGGFLVGSANLHETDGGVLSSFGDVIVVTINYRVGVFGFLNTRTEGAPGNMGLYDQSLALHWIKNNIKRFGGDPEKIVPFGQSAGAISIGLQMSHRKTAKLFSRAITQSGGFLLPQSSKTFEYSIEFAGLVGCLNDTEGSDDGFEFSEEEVDCLKNAPFETLFQAGNSFINGTLTPFIPAADTYYEDFESPVNYIQEEDAFSNIKELLSGVVKDEGTYFAKFMNHELFNKDSYPELTTLTQTRQMYIELGINRTHFPQKVIAIAAENLINGPEKDSVLNNVERLVNTLGDLTITCPAIFSADELVAKNKTVYMYLFNHRPKSSNNGEWMGVVHYEEVPFVFGYPLRRTDIYNKEDIILSERVMKIWSHFAKTGKVLPQLELRWPKYNDNESYMVLEPNGSEIIQSLHEKNCELYKTMILINSR